MTDEQLIRAAVLDVIDDGNGDLAWTLYEDSVCEEDYVNAQRLDFTDAIIVRIKQLREMEEICDECSGINGHKTPFCSKVNLKEVLDGTAEANHPR